MEWRSFGFCCGKKKGSILLGPATRGLSNDLEIVARNRAISNIGNAGLWTCLVCLLTFGCMCDRAIRSPPDEVIIIRYVPGISHRLVRLSDSSLLAEWEALFPDYRTARGHYLKEGGWATALLVFRWDSGEAAWVSVTSNIWSNGRGEFLLKGDFEDVYARTTNHIDGLFSWDSDPPLALAPTGDSGDDRASSESRQAAPREGKHIEANDR